MTQTYTLAEDPDVTPKTAQYGVLETPTFYLDPNFKPPVPYADTGEGSASTKSETKTPMFGLIEGTDDMWFFGYRVNKLKYLAAIIAATVLIAAAWLLSKPKKKPVSKRRSLK